MVNRCGPSGQISRFAAKTRLLRVFLFGDSVWSTGAFAHQDWGGFVLIAGPAFCNPAKAQEALMVIYIEHQNDAEFHCVVRRKFLSTSALHLGLLELPKRSIQLPLALAPDFIDPASYRIGCEFLDQGALL